MTKPSNVNNQNKITIQLHCRNYKIYKKRRKRHRLETTAELPEHTKKKKKNLTCASNFGSLQTVETIESFSFWNDINGLYVERRSASTIFDLRPSLTPVHRKVEKIISTKR